MESNLSKKQLFSKEYGEKSATLQYIVLAIRKPSGKHEIIVKAHNLAEEVLYIVSTYDKDLRMYNNAQIWIENWILV